MTPSQFRAFFFLKISYAVIDHGTGEYSLLAHLQQGSVKVRVGEMVSAGQPLGRVANSGMSTEPHIHYHLMDNASWKRAQGLPAQFHFFNLNGQLVDRGSPGAATPSLRAKSKRGADASRAPDGAQPKPLVLVTGQDKPPALLDPPIPGTRLTTHAGFARSASNRGVLHPLRCARLICDN